MLRLESTGKCSAALVALYAMEVLEVSYEYALRAEGYFSSTYGAPGPLVRDGEAVHLGLRAVLTRAGGAAVERESVQRWLALAMETGSAIGGMRRGGLSVGELAAAQATVQKTLGQLDAALARSSFLCGEQWTVADAPWISLPAQGPMAASTPPAVRAYAERLRARASFGRVEQRRALASAAA